jgi:hypothetical protein
MVLQFDVNNKGVNNQHKSVKFVQIDYGSAVMTWYRIVKNMLIKNKKKP